MWINSGCAGGIWQTFVEEFLGYGRGIHGAMDLFLVVVTYESFLGETATVIKEILEIYVDVFQIAEIMRISLISNSENLNQNKGRFRRRTLPYLVFLRI